MITPASKTAPQEIPDLAKDIYHGDTSSISKSGLAKILAKPSDYYAAYLDPERGAERRTSSLVIGDAVHRLALEPHKFREEFMLAAVKTKTTKAFAKAVAENPGKTVLTEGEWDEVFRMADALWKSPGSRVYLDLCGKAEVSFYWTDPETGVRCRCCPDYLTDDSVYAIDLKTTRDGSPGAFRRQADEHLYWLSAAMTLEGIEAVRRVRPSAYVFLCVENGGARRPEVAVYHVGSDEHGGAEELELGRHYLRKGLRAYEECLRTGRWPGYSQTSQQLGLSAWRRQELARLKSTGELLHA